MEQGKIIVINGPSSSGKTTLALSLKDKMDLPFIRFSFDLFLDGKSLPKKQIDQGVFSWKDIRPSIFKGVNQCQ